MHNKIFCIIGTTASGKTELSIKMATHQNGVVVNFDSMQVYKDIPILTAQPTEVERQGIPHKLFGYIQLDENYNVARWLNDAVEQIISIQHDGKTPILVGGTGMYLKALLEGLSHIPNISQETRDEVSQMSSIEITKKLSELDSYSATKINQNDLIRRKRALEVVLDTGKSIAYYQAEKTSLAFPRDAFHVVRIERTRDDIYNRINQRFDNMLEVGALEEVRRSYNKFGNITYPKAHGLPELIAYINGDLTIKEAITKSKQSTRNYAKRQLTWIRHQIMVDETVEL
jgi:tRNA dimethylallyltransferase